MTRDQANRALAFLACEARPVGARQWKPDDVMAELAKLTDRSLGSVACAVMRAAMDRGAVRPEVISSAGSHWGDTMVPQAFVPRTSTADQRCTICSELEHACQMRWAHDHTFKSAAMAAKEAREIDAAARVAELRADLEPTSGPTERRTIDDLAEANPELHARLERVRANVALKEIPMQEPPPAPIPGDTFTADDLAEGEVPGDA